MNRGSDVSGDMDTPLLWEASLVELTRSARVLRVQTGLLAL